MTEAAIFPHVRRIDLDNDGTIHEVLVVKEDKRNGDLYFIKTQYLDEIDRLRMRQILSRRNAANFELWDLLDQVTLPNGENALKFFHQLVKVRAVSGKIFQPSLSRMGSGFTRQQINDAIQNKPVVAQPTQQASTAKKSKKEDTAAE